MKKNNGVFDVIYICIILNIIPIALLGLFKISNSLYTLLYAFFYFVQSFILIIRLNKFIKHINKRSFLIVLLFLFNNLFALLYSFISFGNVDYKEYLFIISSTLNILFFIVSMDRISVSNSELIHFLKKICFLGIISVIINLILNYNSILSLRFLSNSYAANLSSFFPNRNQFGLFMLIQIIGTSLLVSYKFEKKHILFIIIFTLNLLLTMSRNSILGLVVFAFMILYYKYFKYKVKMSKNKFLLFSLTFIFALFIIYKLLGNEKAFNMINTLFIRMDTLENGSGRFSVWQNGLRIGSEFDFLFGVGRYKALELNKTLFNNSLEYFHSMYIEKFASNGIVGLLLLIYLLKFVWNKVSVCINMGYKIILKSALVSFYVFSIFETTTRFSIGYADTTFLIFFFTIPILISSIKNE